MLGASFGSGHLDAERLEFEVMADPSMRPHPTVQRLRKELGAEIFTGMDQVRGQLGANDGRLGKMRGSRIGYG